MLRERISVAHGMFRIERHSFIIVMLCTRTKTGIIAVSTRLGMLQGSSLPIRATVGQLMDRLTAAGVGERPVIFVAHRWGSWLRMTARIMGLITCVIIHLRESFRFAAQRT